MHYYIGTKVLDAHCYFPEPVNEHPHWLPLLLADTNQCDRGQMMRSAGRKLSVELGHQSFETIYGVGREHGEPSQSSSLQRGGEHPTPHHIIHGVQAHVRCVHVHVLIGVGRAVVAIPIEPLPLI